MQLILLIKLYQPVNFQKKLLINNKMSIKELRKNFLRTLGNIFIVRVVNILCRSLKIKETNKESISRLKNENKNFVAAFWHGTMTVPWFILKNYEMVGLTSKSKDGDLLAKLLRYWKYRVIRGSSSQGGDVALGIMIDHAKNKKSIAITPDGPRGPARKMKPGAIITAKKTGIPVVLIGVGYKNKKILKSWDSFQIPKMFSEVNIIYSEPIYVSKELSYDETSKVIENCEKQLNEIQTKAEIFN